MSFEGNLRWGSLADSYFETLPPVPMRAHVPSMEPTHRAQSPCRFGVFGVRSPATNAGRALQPRLPRTFRKGLRAVAKLLGRYLGHKLPMINPVLVGREAHRPARSPVPAFNSSRRSPIRFARKRACSRTGRLTAERATLPSRDNSYPQVSAAHSHPGKMSARLCSILKLQPHVLTRAALCWLCKLGTGNSPEEPRNKVVKAAAGSLAIEGHIDFWVTPGLVTWVTASLLSSGP